MNSLTYAKAWAIPTTTGIVMIDRRVEMDTSLAEYSVSASNFSANMLMVAPTGALRAMPIAISPTPRKPRRYIIHNPSN